MPPEVILDLVWSADTTTSVGAVHSVMTRLRKTLGADVVRTHDAGYRIEAVATDDAERFVELTRQGAQACAAAQYAEAITLMRQALGLWRGATAYAGVSDELVRADRARLGELRYTATEGLVDALLGAGQAEEALRTALELAEEQPLRERPHGQAMLAAYGCGRQAEALEIYRQLDRRLRSELGITPGPAVAMIQAQILAQADDLPTRPRPVAPSPAGATKLRTAQLPCPTTTTIGRDDHIQQVVQLLDSGRRLVTIIGPGGVGKSRVLAEVGARLSGAHDLLYVDLAGQTAASANDLAEAAAAAYGLVLAPENDPMAELVRSVGQRRLVVLVDEAEWVLHQVTEVVTGLLDGCPGLMFVVTSRVALEVIGEALVPLAPLRCPPEDAPLTEVLAAPAVRLLRDRMLDSAADSERTNEDPYVLAAIARAVDGLPLALELVAGHSTFAGGAELLDLAGSALDVRALDRSRPARHTSLRETLRWSLDRLSPPERIALRRLAVISGPFDVATGLAVIGPLESADGLLDDTEAAAVVRRLVRDALIQVDRRDRVPSARLLRTVKELCLEDCDEQELAAARRRHHQWYAARWRGSPLQDDLISDVRQSYDDYVCALQSALDEGDGPSVFDLIVTLSRFWLFVEAVRVGIHWTSVALESGLLTPGGRARVQVNRAGLLLQVCLERGREALEEAIPVLAAESADDWLACALIASSIERYLAGAPAPALELAEQSAQRALAGAPELLPEALSCVAVMHAALGQQQEALAAAEDAWEHARTSPQAVTFVIVVAKVALALVESGYPRRALEIMDSAEEIGRSRLGVAPLPPTQINALWALLACGEPDEVVKRVVTWCDRMATPDSFLVIEAVTVGVCALSHLGHPAAGSALDATTALLAELGVSLSPWQLTQVNLAKAKAQPSVTATVRRGTDKDAQVGALIALLQSAAGDRTDPRTTSLLASVAPAGANGPAPHANTGRADRI